MGEDEKMWFNFENIALCAIRAQERICSVVSTSDWRFVKLIRYPSCRYKGTLLRYRHPWIHHPPLPEKQVKPDIEADCR